jgi:hypothetical protein
MSVQVTFVSDIYAQIQIPPAYFDHKDNTIGRFKQIRVYD